MSIWRLNKPLGLAFVGAFVAAVVVSLPATGTAQMGIDDLGAKGKADAAVKGMDAAAGTEHGTGAPADDTTEKLKGAAGVGASTTAAEAAKGAGMRGAAEKGGGAAVNEYMKGPAVTPAAGEAALPAGTKGDAETDEPVE